MYKFQPSFLIFFPLLRQFRLLHKSRCSCLFVCLGMQHTSKDGKCSCSYLLVYCSYQILPGTKGGTKGGCRAAEGALFMGLFCLSRAVPLLREVPG